MKNFIRRFVVMLILYDFTFAFATYAATEEERAALEKVNEIRVSNGLSALRYDENLENDANVRANEITVLFSHTRPNGESWFTVDEQLMYGENLADGYTCAEDVVDAWMASPSHKANIMDQRYTTCSISSVNCNGRMYWAQEFGIH